MYMDKDKVNRAKNRMGCIHFTSEEEYVLELETLGCADCDLWQSDTCPYDEHADDDDPYKHLDD